MSLRDAILAKRASEANLERNRAITKAELIQVDGSVRVPGRPGYVWAREYGQPAGVFQVFNPSVTAWAGLPVLIAADPKTPFRRRVIGVDWEILAQHGEYNGDPFLPQHAASHIRFDGYYATDPVDVYLRMLLPLRCEPASGLKVRVAPLVYYVHGARQYYAGTDSLDLSEYVPTVAGKSRRVLIYLDTTTNTAKVAPGPLGSSVPSDPAVPAGGIPSAYILLTHGATALDEKTDFQDVRPLFAIPGAGGGSTPSGAPAGANSLPVCGV
ncbi:MAG: hypothetical protein ACUVS6_13690 [Anaerolineae bacterium]